MVFLFAQRFLEHNNEIIEISGKDHMNFKWKYHSRQQHQLQLQLQQTTRTTKEICNYKIRYKQNVVQIFQLVCSLCWCWCWCWWCTNGYVQIMITVVYFAFMTLEISSLMSTSVCELLLQLLLLLLVWLVAVVHKSMILCEKLFIEIICLSFRWIIHKKIN